MATSSSRRNRPRPPARSPAWYSRGAFVPVALALITLCGAALRLLALSHQGMVAYDGTEYIRYAEALGAGHRFTSVFSPGYPLFIALAHLLVPERVAAAVTVSMLAGILLPLAVWMLARPTLGERGALLPALLSALHLELARHSAVTMSEALFITLLYAGLAALVASRSALSGLLGGLALGLACAVRPEGMVTVLALSVAATVGVVHGRRALGPILAASAACALVLVACVVWYHATLGVWTLTPKTSAMHAVVQDWRAAEPSLAEAATQNETLASRITASVAAWPTNARSHAQALMWSWPWPLLLVSLWGLLRRRGLEWTALVYLPLLPLLGLTQQGRFALAAIPALAISACVPLVRERSRWLRGAALALIVLGQAACLWALMEAFRTPFDGGRTTDRLAGEWLRTTAAPEDVVVDRKPFVAFYAHCSHRMLISGPYDSVLDDIVLSGARWLVLQDYVVRQMRPELAPLLDSASVRARETRLEMVYGRADASDGSLAIFRVLQPGERKRGTPPVVETAGFPSTPPRR